MIAAICEDAKRAVLAMANDYARYEPAAWAWWFTIGWVLGQRYQVAEELPPKLLTLVRRLDALESNQFAANITLILSRGICKQCAATVRPGALRCRFCRAPLPTVDVRTIFLIIVGLPIILVALLVAAGLL